MKPKLKYDSWLNEIEVIIDSREKENSHIKNTFDLYKVKYKIDGLKYGDYTYLFNNKVMGCVIERKNSLDEISQNFTKNRDRFKREWDKIPFSDTKHLVIEGNTLNDIYLENYRSKLHINSFLASLLSFESRYNIKTHFVSKTFVGLHILKLFYYTDYYIKAWQYVRYII